MTEPTRRITIDDLMAVTGLGPITTRRLVRAGELPGAMKGRNYVCPPGEFDRYVRGDWQPKPQQTTEPIQMVHKKAS